MTQATTGEIVEGLWRFEALHPEWTEQDGDEEGWEQCVACWAVATAHGLVLIDPLVDDWAALDALITENGGCAGIVRTCHWHERSIPEVKSRYDVGVWARPDPSGRPPHLDHETKDGDELFNSVKVIDVERADEIALWLPQQRHC